MWKRYQSRHIITIIKSISIYVHWYYLISIFTLVYKPLPEEAPPGLPACTPQVRTVNPSKPKVTVGHSRGDVHGFYAVHLRPLGLWGQPDHTPHCSRWAAGWNLVMFTGGRLRREGAIVFQHLSMTTWQNNGGRNDACAEISTSGTFSPSFGLMCW